METNQPEAKNIEIILFGPGVGESMLVHLGNGEWLIVDSCRVGNSGKPAALEYLESIGVNPADAVRLVVATHWHNDHIKGLSQIVAACPKAKFSCPQVLLGDEFRTLIELQNLDDSFPSDSSEFDRIIRHFARIGSIQDRLNYPLVYAAANKRIYSREATANLARCEIFSLSPSDMAVSKWLQVLGNEMTPGRKIRKRLPPPHPNQISSALWVSVANTNVLLSADLEEQDNDTGGWSVVVASRERPQGVASANKIPHHGSQNGHCEEVWTEMLTKNPIALVAPYNSGKKKLPSAEDIKRICSFTDKAFVTSKHRDKTFRGKTGSVNRTMNEIARSIRTVDSERGYIRISKDATNPDAPWNIQLHGKACALAEMTDEELTE